VGFPRLSTNTMLKFFGINTGVVWTFSQTMVDGGNKTMSCPSQFGVPGTTGTTGTLRSVTGESVVLVVSLLARVVDIIGSRGMMFETLVPFVAGLIVE